MSKIDWQKEFNALDEKTRIIGCACDARTRINQLKIEKDRLINRHKKSLSEINQHIANCERSLNDLENSYIKQSGR